MMNGRIGFWLACLFATPSVAQNLDSSIHVEYMSEIALVGAKQARDALFLPEVVGTKINAGKKNSLVILDNANAIVVNNSMRQLLAKVPGMHIWESDGSGIQIGIAHRGLSPNRSWEFNIRQNGYDIAADPFGYPEAYYNPQMQAVQRIQILKGAGSLQYGPQFGGLINYIMKDGSHIEKPLEISTDQTWGSYGLRNQFLSLGGQQRNVHYYAFVDSRSGQGFRANAAYETQTAFATASWKLTPEMSLGAEFMQYTMLSQQPGGLIDSLVFSDPQRSERSRNWFSTPWKTAQIKWQWDPSNQTRIQAHVFGLSADRKSIGFLGQIQQPDTAQAQRELAIDLYRNWGSEAGLAHQYSWLGLKQTFTAGVRYYQGLTDRSQKGRVSSVEGPDFNPSQPYGVGLTFFTQNAALFAENVFRLTPRLLLIPGIRSEWIQSTANGYQNRLPDGQPNWLPESQQTRRFTIAAISAEWHLNNGLEVYANHSQAYRPILFSDMLANTGSVVIDSELRDASGTNSDLGFRGIWGSLLMLDLSVYRLQYNNRMGSLTQMDDQGNFYTYKTNVGQSLARGFESLIEFDPMRTDWLRGRFQLPLFISYAWNQAQYQDYRYSTKTSSGLVFGNLQGNQIENAPKHILRTGASVVVPRVEKSIQNLELGVQYSYVSETYSDANNTQTSSPNGQTGLIPSYSLWDINAKLDLPRQAYLKLAIQNATDARYFTRRAGGYPGPGAMPGEGRSILISLGITL
ncbi:MAG: TonB-dependent receptor family protein [Bacteroidia bacterium]